MTVTDAAFAVAVTNSNSKVHVHGWKFVDLSTRRVEIPDGWTYPEPFSCGMQGELNHKTYVCANSLLEGKWFLNGRCPKGLFRVEGGLHLRNVLTIVRIPRVTSYCTDFSRLFHSVVKQYCSLKHTGIHREHVSQHQIQATNRRSRFVYLLFAILEHSWQPVAPKELLIRLYVSRSQPPGQE